MNAQKLYLFYRISRGMLWFFFLLFAFVFITVKIDCSFLRVLDFHTPTVFVAFAEEHLLQPLTIFLAFSVFLFVLLKILVCLERSLSKRIENRQASPPASGKEKMP